MPSWKVPGKGWRYRFQYEGQKYGRGFYPTKTESKAAEAEHKKSLKEELSKEIPSGFVQFSEEYLDYWRRRSEGDPQAKTFKEKKFVHKSFLAHLGQDLTLSEITPVIIEAYLKTRPTNSNWNKHRKNLCAFFQWCFKRGLIGHNPCLHVEVMPTKPRRKIIPSQDDVLRLFMAAGELRTFFLALYSLAARVGEINRLRWEDINFERRMVTLWTRKGKGGWRAQQKAMNAELAQELQKLYKKDSGEWVFPNPETGLPFVDRRKQLKRICKDAGIPYLGFHAIRHHVASLLADQYKESLPTIQKMLGHTRVSTTDRYIQSMTEDQRTAAEKLTPIFDRLSPEALTRQ
jgi:integrase